MNFAPGICGQNFPHRALPPSALNWLPTMNPENRTSAPADIRFRRADALVSSAGSAQFVNVLAQVALKNAHRLLFVDDAHLLIVQAQPQVLVGVVGRRSIRKLLAAILHGKEIDMMR